MTRDPMPSEEWADWSDESAPWSYEYDDGPEDPEVSRRMPEGLADRRPPLSRPQDRMPSRPRRTAGARPQLHLPPSMPPREAKRRRLSPLSVGLGIGAVGCFALAIGLGVQSALAQRRMAELSPIDGLIEDADLVTEDRDGLPLTDEEAAELAPDPWEDAEESFPGLVAWLEIEGAGISTPVMQATEDAPDWFLDHDAFGNESASGLPYLDYRSAPDGLLRVVYAHNLGWGSSEGFGTLADAWQQDTFEGIGTVRWANLTASGRPSAAGTSADGQADGETGGEREVVEFRPICALKVDGTETDLLDFDLSPTETGAWLDTITPHASALSSDGIAGGAMSSHYLALVTCSGDGYPSQSRTLVLFGDGDEDYFTYYGDLLEGISALTEKMGESETEDVRRTQT